MAHQFFYPHGSQHQNNLKCGGCDCTNYLAAQGFWNSFHPDGHTYLKNHCDEFEKNIWDPTHSPRNWWSCLCRRNIRQLFNRGE